MFRAPATFTQWAKRAQENAPQAVADKQKAKK